MNVGEFDVGLVAALAFQLRRNAADNYHCVNILGSVLDVGKIGVLTLANVGAEHCKRACAALVFNLNLDWLALLNIESLVLGGATEESATLIARLGDFVGHSIDGENVAIVGHYRITHLAGESGGVFARNPH